ncbi:MAG TPA: AAA family ATPase [Phycisphaerae bacterium]|nr:AAA family ATPase [Phycisphaerae bacterium]HNU44756.1 AAA family ATPase [Phycisphaerae bacterium]
MDIAAYLRQQKDHLGQEAKSVRDFSVFDFDHIPDQPLLREEAKLLIDELLRFDITGIPTHYAIIGSRGSGKTLTLRYLQRVVPKHTSLQILYANCREHNTSFKILAHLLGVQARGASLSEMFERFCASCPQKTAVILDEIDLMSPKDPRREILYRLSRAEQPFLAIALANNPQVLKEIDPATRSSLQPMPLHFRHYNAAEISQILRDRAERGLVAWDEGRLAEIAALTVRQTNADVRVAIKTLFYTVTRPEESLAACFEHARRDIIIDIINDLTDPLLLILRAVQVAPTAFAKDVYGRYVRLCQARGEKPFSYVHFYSSLSYLQSVGLVALVATKVGRTFTNRVLLNFDQPIVEQICRLRFGE